MVRRQIITDDLIEGLKQQYSLTIRRTPPPFAMWRFSIPYLFFLSTD